MNLQDLSQAERIVYAEALANVVSGDKGHNWQGFIDDGWYGEYRICWDTVAAVLFATEEQKQKAFNIAKGIK